MKGLEWQDLAVCAETDPDLFFPDAGETQKSKKARAFCATCPVIRECAELGEQFDFGIFGGTTGPQRVKARRNAA